MCGIAGLFDPAKRPPGHWLTVSADDTPASIACTENRPEIHSKVVCAAPIFIILSFVGDTGPRGNDGDKTGTARQNRNRPLF